MPLLDPMSRDDQPAHLVPLWDQLEREYPKFRNLWSTMAHAPAVFEHIWSGYRALNRSDVVTQRQFELVVLVVSTLTKCRYCVSHHGVRALRAGLTEAQVESIEQIAMSDSVEPGSLPLFDEDDQLLIALACHVVWAGTHAQTHDVHPSAVQTARVAVHERLRTRFTPRQIEELTWRVVQCVAFNWHNDFLEIEFEA